MAGKGEELKKLRQSLGVSQATLAEELGVTQAYISNLEKTHRENDQLVEKAKEFLRNVVVPGRGAAARAVRALKYSPRSSVHSDKAGTVSWAWTSFSRSRDTSDIFDYASVSTRSSAILVADIVGSGLRGSWEAAQIRFAFQAIAATLTRHTNHPSGYLGPLATALSRSKLRTVAPPSIAIGCVDCSKGIVNLATLGLPAPIIYRRNKDSLSRVEVQAADLLTTNPASIQYQTITLDKEDSLILGTDGFYDWLKRTKGLTANAINGLFLEACKYFSGNASGIVNSVLTAQSDEVDQGLTDDATIVVISADRRQGGR